MTPHELNLHIAAYNKRMRSDSDEQIVAAYLNAYWHRVKKMPSIKEVLRPADKQKPQVPQTPEQMLEAVKKLNAAFGGGTSR